MKKVYLTDVVIEMHLFVDPGQRLELILLRFTRVNMQTQEMKRSNLRSLKK
ncbi:hypothetical protein [Candidatus Kryptobacter tengchongensis]|uniref:hypothetical protein n=1 Tax=Kryptobacter tengchongensis TaxID=1643429 RepID=UPI0013520BE4|nr:hypothetical protein [Candidatus Kryptobacter tengchongensis]